MPANDLTLNQISTVLNSIVNQATGKNTITPTNTSEFVAVAQTALLSGYDNLLQSISQVLSRTIFSIRPYARKFGGIEVSNQKFGNHVRKLSIGDSPFQDDDRLPLTTTPDMFDVSTGKPNILQTNWYGQQPYQKDLLLYRDQLDVAFSGPEEFSSFITMCMSNVNDMLEQARENLARATVGNFIAGKVIGDLPSVYHALTDYNAATGLSLTATAVYQPANFKPFMQWLYAYIGKKCSLMTERSQLFHINVTNFGGVDKTVMRHTPMERQRVYLYTDARLQSEAMVLADAYHDNYLKYAYNESVNFWQSITTPDQLNITPVYLNSDGSLITPASPTVVENLLAVIFDEEALGYTIINQWSAPTPFEARGGYSKIYWHETVRYWNDFTENGIVILLD